MEAFKETVFFREIMLRFDKANKTMDNWKSHEGLILKFMDYFVKEKIPEKISIHYHQVFTGFFYEYEPRNQRMTQELVRHSEMGHVLIYPPSIRKKVAHSLAHNITDLSLGTLYVMEVPEGDDGYGNSFTQYYIFPLGISLPRGLLLDLFNSFDWDMYNLYLTRSGEIGNIPITFEEFMAFVADVTYLIEDQDTNVLEEMNLTPAHINELLEAAKDEIEQNRSNLIVIKGLGHIFYELLIVRDLDDELDDLCTLFLYFHKINDPFYFRDAILNSLRYDALPSDINRKPLIYYDRDIINFIYQTHLPREKMMCGFHRYLFGRNGQPIEEFNSQVAQEIRANWDQICKIGDSGILL
jgi:hypothetical protein